MNTETIVTVFLAAAAGLKDPASAVAAQAFKDLYAAAKYYLRRKLVDHPDASRALEFATEKPESAARKASFIEEAEPLALGRDREFVALMQRLSGALPHGTDAKCVSVTVEGRGNEVKVAGRDLIVTERHVRRVAITPDDRHLMHEQRRRLLEVIHELAERLARPSDRPNLAAVHAMLQCRFDVPSYLLIPRERYAEALAFLEQQRAIHRLALRRRDPAAFRRDLFRAIFSRATELGWSKDRVHEFARERLHLKQPLTSLKQLGPQQLRTLVERMRRATPAPAEV